MQSAKEKQLPDEARWAESEQQTPQVGPEETDGVYCPREKEVVNPMMILSFGNDSRLYPIRNRAIIRGGLRSQVMGHSGRRKASYS